jgi:hypothetical protein
MPDKECVSAVGWFWMTLNAKSPERLTQGFEFGIAVAGADSPA